MDRETEQRAQAWLDEVDRADADGGYAAGDAPPAPVEEVRALLAEARRLRDGISAHRELCESMQEAIGGPHTPQDEALWSLLDSG